MKITKFDNQTDWLAARRGRISGSTLKDLVVLRGNEEKAGFYKIIADKLSLEAPEENPMARGHRLEEFAMHEFTQITGKDLCTDLVIWSRDDNPALMVSPDGYVDGKKISEAVEVKCLDGWKHIQAKIDGEIPDDYKWQRLQYFIVNDDLELLHFVFHNPNFIPHLQTFILTFDRADFEVEIEKYRTYEQEKMKKINQLVAELST